MKLRHLLNKMVWNRPARTIAMAFRSAHKASLGLITLVERTSLFTTWAKKIPNGLCQYLSGRFAEYECERITAANLVVESEIRYKNTNLGVDSGDPGWGRTSSVRIQLGTDSSLKEWTVGSKNEPWAKAVTGDARCKGGMEEAETNIEPQTDSTKSCLEHWRRHDSGSGRWLDPLRSHIVFLCGKPLHVDALPKLAHPLRELLNLPRTPRNLWHMLFFCPGSQAVLHSYLCLALWTSLRI